MLFVDAFNPVHLGSLLMVLDPVSVYFSSVSTYNILDYIKGI
jgi:hypothetical protein